MRRERITKVVFAVLAGLGIVALLAYARGEPGDAGRQPEPPSSAMPADVGDVAPGLLGQEA